MAFSGTVFSFIGKTENHLVVSTCILFLVCLFLAFAGAFGFFCFFLGTLSGAFWFFYMIEKLSGTEIQSDPTNSKKGGGPIQVNAISSDKYHVGDTIVLEESCEIQFGGRNRHLKKRYCFIKGEFLHVQQKKGQDVDELKIWLKGCIIRFVDKEEIGEKFGLEIMHPGRKLLYRIDYVYLFMPSSEIAQLWYYRTTSDGLCSRDPDDMIKRVANILSPLNVDINGAAGLKPETSMWFNTIMSHLWEHMSESKKIRSSLSKYMIQRLGSKLTEKGLNDFIENPVITSLSIGEAPPTFSNMHYIPTTNGELAVDFDIDYDDGTAKFDFSLTLSLKLTTVDINLSVLLKKLKGKIYLRCLPFLDHDRFTLSFKEMPETSFEIKFEKGVKDFLKSKLRRIMVEKMNLLIKERFVAPNRKYVKIPGSNKKDPKSSGVKFRVHEGKPIVEVKLESGENTPSENRW